MVKIQVLDQECYPVCPVVGDAGLDLRAREDAKIYPGTSKVVPLGVAFGIPLGIVGKLTHRSSVAFNGSTISSLGIIDSSFTGEVKIKLFNLGHEYYMIEKGDRIAQIIFERHEDPRDLEFVDSLEKGKKGFGSSGVN